MTYFILWANAVILWANTVKKQGSGLVKKKNDAKWTGRVDIRTWKKFLAVSKAYMAIF